MKTNIVIDINIHQILCWLAMVLLAANPMGIFDGFLDAMGYNLPFLLLATGAGSEYAKKLVKGGKP